MTDETGFRFGLASGTVVLALLLAAALPLDRGETAAVALVAAAGAAAFVPWILALVLGTEAWAFFTGFFENRYGVLTLADQDLLRLLGFAMGTVLLARVFRTPFELANRGDTR